MITRPLVLLVLSFVFLPSQAVRSEVIHGSQGIYATYMAYYPYGSDEAFDFVTRTIVSWSSTSADLSCAGNAMGDEMTLNSKNCIGTVVDTPLEQLAEAPEGLVPFGATAQLNRTYVVKTGDNIYAKFAVRSMDWAGILIEYYVQMDGSPSFGPALAVEHSTWGRVKALYR
jgi:hypothetical protein